MTRTRWRTAVYVLALLNALPVFATRHPPFPDLPEHVAAMATVARLLTEGPSAAVPFTVSVSSSQYFLFHGVGALLTLLTGDAVVASQLLLAACAVGWPLAFAALCRAMGRDERLTLLAPALFWNRALAMGFAPFVASVPVALITLALVVRARGGLRLALLSTLLFYTHVSAWILVVATSIVWMALVVGSRQVARRAAASVAASMLPSTLAALVWWRARSLAPGPVAVESMQRFAVTRAIRAVPFWTFDIWESHVDDVCAAFYWLAFGIVLASGLRARDAKPRTRAESVAALLPFVPLAVAAAVYLTTPFSVGFASMLNVRLAPVVALLAILALAPARRRLADVGFGLAALATLVNAANGAREMRRAEREGVGDLDALLAHAKPNTRLAMLSFERPTAGTHFWPYLFAGAYHRARGGSVASWSFTELAHWSLGYLPAYAPPRRPPFSIFDPCVYQYEEDGAYYDYVLVSGKERPFEGAVPGPRFEPIATSRSLTLYAKQPGSAEASAASAASAASGPCSLGHTPTPH